MYVKSMCAKFQEDRLRFERASKAKYEKASIFLNFFASEWIKVGVTLSNRGIIYSMRTLSCSTLSHLSNEPMNNNIGCLVQKIWPPNQEQLAPIHNT